MEAGLSIHFFIDEHLPARALGQILTARGHRATPVQVGFKDPAILVTADEVGAVIMTADRWFLRELYRYPAEHRRRYLQAGVVQVPGEWDAAQRRIIDWLPVVEAVYQMRQGQADRRLGIDLSGAAVRIEEAKLRLANPDRSRRQYARQAASR